MKLLLHLTNSATAAIYPNGIFLKSLKCFSDRSADSIFDQHSSVSDSLASLAAVVFFAFDPHP